MSITLVLVGLTSCPERSQEPVAPSSRFVAVSGAKAADAAKKFCEQSLPKSGPAAKRFADPPERPLPSATAAKPQTGDGWRWINLWATWCTPCMAETPLLDRWHRGLNRDGIKVALELWSVDDDEAALRQAVARGDLPGRLRWMRSFDDLAPFLDRLGLAKDAALPIHLMVDPEGMLRCVRVGAVHDEDYGAVRAILRGG